MKILFIILISSLGFLLIHEKSYAQSDYLSIIAKEVNAAFYIRGTPQELRKSGCLKRKGGIFFGWALGLKVNDKYIPNVHDFMKINRLKTTIISGGLSKIKKIYPKRDPWEYTIRGNQLIIKDPYGFWREYKFVIISHK